LLNSPLLGNAQQSDSIWKQQHYKSIHNTAIYILSAGSIEGYVAEKFTQMGFNING
jgi:hypothetical protein